MEDHLELTVEAILSECCFWKVRIALSSGAEFTGYILDIILPVNEDIFFHFLEANKAKRYLAKYNPTWLMPMPFFMITELEPLDYDEVSETLEYRRIDFYS